MERGTRCRQWRARQPDEALALVLVGILLMGMVAPQPAYAQGGLLSGITGILNALNGAAAALQNFINNVMRPILQSISAASSAVQNILGTLRNFFEQVVWPVAEINRIRALVQQLIAQFSGALNTLYGINVSSAQLPNPRHTRNHHAEQESRRPGRAQDRLRSDLWSRSRSRRRAS